MKKMYSKKILVICLIIILCVSIGISVHLFEEKKRVEIKALQLHLFGQNWPYPIYRLWDYSMDDFINLLGEPNHIQKCWKFKPNTIYTTLYYDTFCVNLIHLDSEDECSFANIMITDSNQKIWRNDISIGSTKAEVEAAFRHVPKEPSMPNAYIDTVWGVSFEYSQNDIVTLIILYR